jgi:hypothetical protein
MKMKVRVFRPSGDEQITAVHNTLQMLLSSLIIKNAVFWDDTPCVSEKYITSIIRQTRIGELRTTFAVTSNRITLSLMMEALRSFETSFLTRATRR